MKVIYKLGVRSLAPTPIIMPPDSKILHFAMQGNEFFIWFSSSGDMSQAKHLYTAHIIGTGQAYDNLEYFGTVQEGPYVWHLMLEKV